MGAMRNLLCCSLLSTKAGFTPKKLKFFKEIKRRQDDRSFNGWTLQAAYSKGQKQRITWWQQLFQTYILWIEAL